MTHQHTKAHPDVLAQLHKGSIEGALNAVRSLRLDFCELPLAYREIFRAIRALPERSGRRDGFAGTAFNHLLNIGSLELASEALLLMTVSDLQAQLSIALQQKLASQIVFQTCGFSEGFA